VIWAKELSNQQVQRNDGVQYIYVYIEALGERVHIAPHMIASRRS
jgi:hypothetical protein